MVWLVTEIGVVLSEGKYCLHIQYLEVNRIRSLILSALRTRQVAVLSYYHNFLVDWLTQLRVVV